MGVGGPSPAMCSVLLETPRRRSCRSGEKPWGPRPLMALPVGLEWAARHGSLSFRAPENPKVCSQVKGGPQPDPGAEGGRDHELTNCQGPPAAVYPQRCPMAAPCQVVLSCSLSYEVQHPPAPSGPTPIQ